MPQTSFSVGSQTALNNAIETIDSTTTAGTYTITLTGDITPAGSTGGYYVLSLAPGVVVDIDGANHTISGEAFNEAFYGGLAVTTGTVSISDLTLKDTLARGAHGPNGGGGGGAGLGGGLFVGPDAKVSLSNVQFVDDAAQGGAGGTASPGQGGGGGHSSLIYPALGGGGTAGVAGLPGTDSDTPGGDGSDGKGGGFGVAGGDGGGGGKGFVPGTFTGQAGSDGGNGGKGGLGGIGGNGGNGGPGGDGGSGSAPIQTPWDGGDAGNGGAAGDAGDGGYGAGGGAGEPGGSGGRGALGLSGGPFNGVPSDGGDGGDGSKGGDGGFGGGGGAGGAGGFGGGGGTGQGVDGANGGAGGKGGGGGNGDFGAGGGGGGPGGNGGAAGPTNAGVGSPGSAGPGGSGGQAGLGGFGGGKGAAGSNGFVPVGAESPYTIAQPFGGAGGGGLGAGGAIFVADGGQLTVDGGLITGGTVVGGASGGPGAGAGSFYGSGMFIDGDTTVTLAAPTGAALTISNVIADEKGSGGVGKGTLSIGTGGTVDLDATNTFTGGITIKGGTLELSAPGAAGTGQITFDALGGPTLMFRSTAAPSNPISGLGLGNFIGVTDKTLSGDQYNPGSLVLDFAGGGSVTLTIVGSYSQSDFLIVDNQIAVISSDVIDLPAGNSTVTVTDEMLSGGAVTINDGASGNNTISAVSDTSVSKGKTLIYNAGSGTDTFTGGFENDTVKVSAAAVGGDTLTGGSGTNTLTLTSAGSANLGGVSKFPTINLAAGNSTVTITDKTLSGGPVAVHDGASGNNSVSATTDTSASTGKSVSYYTGSGTDQFTGGFENDTVNVSSAAVGGDMLTGGSGNNECSI